VQAILHLVPEGGVHVDLNANNLLVARAALPDDEPGVWILDLDRSYFDTELDDEVRRRTLRRLYRHVERLQRDSGDTLSRTAFARFLRGYDPAGTRWKDDWRAIAIAHRRPQLVHGFGWLLEKRFGGDRSTGASDPDAPASLKSPTR
jgi:hypothetical protein